MYVRSPLCDTPCIPVAAAAAAAQKAKKGTKQVAAQLSIGKEDYFNYRPWSGTHNTSAREQFHVPSFLPSYAGTRTPLSTGPAGYTYTPLYARTQQFESFRHDYGVRYKTRVSAKAVFLGFRWRLLLDEDAFPARARDDGVAFLKSVKRGLRRGALRCRDGVSRFWRGVRGRG